MTILDTIVAQKKIEVAEQQSKIAIAELEQSRFFQLPSLSLKSNLQDSSKTGIIAEFKRKSPSKGIINGIAKVEDVTMAYTQFGAAGISVLTDAAFFGGNLTDLEAATINQIPLLRKDFMISEYQIIEAKASGASVILLIAACLSASQVKQFSRLAHQLGLEVLLEIHDDTELDHICDEVDLVGVNNRNLKNFEVNIDISLGLINQIPTSIPAIAESGIDHPNTIVTLQKAGFAGFLIGERFMRETNPSFAFANFVNDLKTKQNEG
jgi:indole-3-glycerol phosphate synthase